LDGGHPRSTHRCGGAGREILVSSLVRELIESSGAFSFEDPVEVELKGLAGFHRVSAVRWRTE